MRTLDQILDLAEQHIDRRLNECRYRARLFWSERGATKAEQDAALEWLEQEIEVSVRQVLHEIREHLTQEIKH